MDRQALIAQIKTERYAGKRFQEDEATHSARLFRSLDRFDAYLREQGIERVEDTTLEVLKAFPFNYPENDDEHLRWVFSYLGRRELVETMGMVSADKYFHNKKLRTAFKALPELSAYIPDLRPAGIRMAAELLERGATPAGRAEISEASGVPEDVVLELVHCADLCRMTGMGGKTLYRAREMGYDTLAKCRAVTPEQIEADLIAYLASTGERTNRMIRFSSFVHQARRLADVVVG